MSINNFLPFAPTDTGTNLLTQSQYAAASDRTNGNQPGVASSKLNNKALRQSAFITSQFAQWISNVLAQDVLDDGVPANLLAQLYAALAFNGSPALQNLSFTTSVGSNALTIALKTQAGSNPSATDVSYISFRSATATTGDYNRRSISSALSMVVSSGSTLGTVSAVPCFLNLYAIDNAGTVELGICNGTLDEGSLQTSVAEGGAGAADSSGVLYSTTARANVAVRLIGRILITEATAGTWASNSTELAVVPFKNMKTTDMVAALTGGNLTIGTSATEIVFDGVVSDTNSDYNPSTGRFTAKTAGYYLVNYNFQISTSASGPSFLDLYILKNATGSKLAKAGPGTNSLAINGTYTFNGSRSIYLNVGDFISIWGLAGGNSVTAVTGSSTDERTMFNVIAL